MAVGLVVVTAAVFGRAVGFGYVYFDDQVYAASNAAVHAGLTPAGVRYAFTHRIVNNWHPLTVLVLEGLSTAFGPSAATFHAANVALHAAAVAMLFAFLRRATGRRWRAAAVAALWGLHPLRVESVAWIAEIKDELSSVTWLGCLLAYTAYARHRTWRRYATVAALYVLAVLAKPIAVTLPFVLLLTDVWPLGRSDPGGRPTPASELRRRPGSPGAAIRYGSARVAEKLPLLAVAAAAAAVAVYGQASPHVLVRYPLSARAANAVVSVVAYLRQTVWPTGLAPFYPHPRMTGRPPTATAVAVAVVVLACLTAGAAVAARRRPYLIVGWLWFLGVLVPNVGLLQAGEQARADRFTLLPGIGLTVAAVWLVADLTPAAARWAAGGLTVVAAVALATATVRLLPTWRDARSFWDRADAVVPDNYVARAQRAANAARDGQFALGRRLADQAVAIAPDASDGYAALALNLDGLHRPAEAAVAFATAVPRDSADPLLRYQFGDCLRRQHRDAEARVQLERAVQLDPTLVEPRQALAEVLARQGDRAGAIDQLQRCLSLVPHDAGVQAQLAAVRATAPPGKVDARR